jgi:colanic acid biosynthesis glycosyl transferase WcaI
MKSNTLYVFCQLFYPELISTGQTVTELCEALQKKGQNITVFCAQPTLIKTNKVNTELHYKGIQINRLKSTRFSKLNFFGKLSNHISFSISCFFKLWSLPKNATVLVFTNPPILPLIVRLVKTFKSIHYTVVLFDLYPQSLVAQGLLKKSSIVTKLYLKLINSAYNNASHLVSIGRCMKHLVDSQLSNSQKSIYIPIWADTTHIQNPKKQKDFKKEWDLENSFIVGYSGNLALFHPIETMIYAAEKMQDYKEIKFLFIGEGSKKKWAQAYCAKHNLTNCLFYPYVARDHLGDLLSIFDCGLVGLNEKNTGLSVPSKTMGLLSAGVPIIGCLSAKSEIGLILNELQCGLTSESSDINSLIENILFLFKNTQKRHELSKNALYAVNSKFNLDKITLEYLQILSKS